MAVIIQLISERPRSVSRGWKSIMNAVYQNSQKSSEFIHVLIIFDICILSLLDLLLPSFPSEVGWKSPWSFCGAHVEESVQEVKKAGRDVQSPTDQGLVPWPGHESSCQLLTTFSGQELHGVFLSRGFIPTPQAKMLRGSGIKRPKRVGNKSQ